MATVRTGAVARAGKRSSPARIGKKRYYKKTPTMAAYRRTKRAAYGYTTSLRQPVRGFLGPLIEQKFFDSISILQITNVLPPVHIDIVPRGTGVSERDGKAWRAQGLQFNGICRLLFNGTPAVGPNSHNCAVYLVWDFQPNAALPISGAILDNPGANFQLALPNRDNQSRFRFLWGRRFSFTHAQTPPAAGVEPGTLRSEPISETIRFPPGMYSEATEADSTGVIANRIRGALYWLAVSDSNTTSNAWYPEWVVQNRLSFSDRG